MYLQMGISARESMTTSCTSTGPWPTFEIQLPQDDFHLLAWQLGERIGCKEELGECRETYHLRGLPDDRALLDGMGVATPTTSFAQVIILCIRNLVTPRSALK